MSEVQFHQARMGRQLFEATLPELGRPLTRLNGLLALGVEMIEKRAAEAPGDRRGKPAP